MTRATGLGSPDGLALDEGGSRAFVSDSGADMLLEISLPAGDVTELGSYDFGFGFGESGVLFDPLGTLILVTGEDDLTLEALTVFPIF